MTTVDDNLLATSLRSAKPGSKSAGKHHEMDAAKQRSAFDNAFADAGRKKMPTIAIDGKAAAETAPRANIAIAQTLRPGLVKTTAAVNDVIDAQAQAKADSRVKIEAEMKTAVVAVDKPSIDTVAKSSTDALKDDRSVQSRFASKDDLAANLPAVGNAPDAASLPAAKVLPMVEAKQDLTVPADVDETQTSILPKIEARIGELPSVSLQHVGADAIIDAGKTVDGPIGEKIADLVKDPAAKLSKPSDVKTEKQGSVSKPADEDALVTATPAADVSQLLTLLSAAQKPAAAGAAARPEATPAMSEFHALADRAGKAAALPKDATTAKPATTDKTVAATDKQLASAESDQVFRFARADGKGQAVSMNLSSDGDKAVVKNDASVANAKAETVTVMEARRYLGLAPTSNAAAVTSQIVGNPEWAKALQPTEASAPLTAGSTGKVLNTLKIQMHPIDLGTVTATLRLKDDELHVELKVETGDAFRQLSDDQNAMVKALRAQGFAVDQVNIVFNASDTSGGTTQQQAQPQTGQQGREASTDGSAQGKGQRNDNDSQQQDGGRWSNEGTSDPSSGLDANRAGDVYM